MNKIKSKRKMLIVFDIILIAITLTALIVTIWDMSSNESRKTSFQTTVIAEDGSILSIDTDSAIEVASSGSYYVHACWSGEEDPGFVTGLEVCDHDDEIIFTCTGDTGDFLSDTIALSEGTYKLKWTFIESDAELREYIKVTEAEVYGDEFNNYQENGAWPMSYEVELQKSINDGWSLCIVLATILGLLIGALINLCNKMNNSVISEYDERQEEVRGRAYRLGFMIMAVYMGLVALADVIKFNIPAETVVINVFGILISYCAISTVNILNDCYFALNENRKGLCISMIVILILNIAATINNIINGTVIINGVLSIGSLNIIVLVFIIYIFVLLLVKSRIDKREAEA